VPACLGLLGLISECSSALQSMHCLSLVVRLCGCCVGRPVQVVFAGLLLQSGHTGNGIGNQRLVLLTIGTFDGSSTFDVSWLGVCPSCEFTNVALWEFDATSAPHRSNPYATVARFCCGAAVTLACHQPGTECAPP
jgi:hypothetical protein